MATIWVVESAPPPFAARCEERLQFSLIELIEERDCKMPVAGEFGDIPDYANCEVARINSGYKDDDDIGQGWDHVFRLLRHSFSPKEKVICHHVMLNLKRCLDF